MLFARNVTKMMMARSAPGECWREMNIEYLRVMLPELAATQKVMQRQGETVYQHTLKVLNALESKNPVTLWAAIFHDTGKASFPRQGYFSKTAFPKHEIISTELAERRLTHWQADGGLILDVTRLVRGHMIDIAGFKHPQAYRSFIASVGLCNIDNWFALRRADSMAYGINPTALGMIGAFQAGVSRYIEQMPRLTVSDLAVTPEQIASVAALDDEEQTGRIVARLLDAVNSGVCGNLSAQLVHAARLYAGMDRGGKGIVLG